MRNLIGVQAPHTTVSIDGVSIAYSDEGQGQPVVCLHATAQGGRDYEHIRPMLLSMSGYRIIVVDWPGHGLSSDDHAAFTAQRCEAVLLKFLESLGIERAILIGNSIGGAAALRLAHSHPQRVKAVVACNPGGLAPINVVAKVFCSMMAGVARMGQRRSVFFKPIFWLFCQALLRGASAAQQRQRIVAAGYENARVMEQAWISFMQDSGDIRAMMPGIACPVLFAWAQDDGVVALKASRPAIESVPNHQLALFPGGHCAYLEEPEQFFPEFQNFVQSLGK
jgi:pimeloyl-ACP methyl ester carboxylesterase